MILQSELLSSMTYNTLFVTLMVHSRVYKTPPSQPLLLQPSKLYPHVDGRVWVNHNGEEFVCSKDHGCQYRIEVDSTRTLCTKHFNASFDGETIPTYLIGWSWPSSKYRERAFVSITPNKV